MARKQTTKTAASNELLVCISKDNKGDEQFTNAKLAPQVFPAELQASLSVNANLCLNLIAGNVHADILEAHSKHGGIARLFPTLANADKTAIKICLDSTPGALANGWAKHAATVKRIRGISLQALAKSIKAKKASEEKVTLRSTLEAWCADKKNQAIMDAKGFPQSLYDIFAEFELIAEDEEV